VGPTCQHLLPPLISLPPLLHCPRLARRAPLLHPATVPTPWPLLHRRPYMLYGCFPSSIPSERRPPELYSAAEDLAQARFTREDATTGESRGRRQAPPPGAAAEHLLLLHWGWSGRRAPPWASELCLPTPLAPPRVGPWLLRWGRGRRTPPLGPTPQPSPGQPPAHHSISVRTAA
jgi:hypothetical protein